MSLEKACMIMNFYKTELTGHRQNKRGVQSRESKRYKWTDGQRNSRSAVYASRLSLLPIRYKIHRGVQKVGKEATCAVPKCRIGICTLW